MKNLQTMHSHFLTHDFIHRSHNGKITYQYITMPDA